MLGEVVRGGRKRESVDVPLLSASGVKATHMTLKIKDPYKWRSMEVFRRTHRKAFS